MRWEGWVQVMRPEGGRGRVKRAGIGAIIA
jgi:hypothetical protein